ncbi:MAG: hypothetical protein ABI886_08810 [Betaproteobacteria bacterium]
MPAALHVESDVDVARLRALIVAAVVAGSVPQAAHRRPDPGIDNDDDEETERPIGDPDDDEGIEDDDEDDDEEPLQV